MILIGQLDSPFVRRVAVTMHVYGIDFERQVLSVFADAEELRTLNPLGKVPALQIDPDEILFDSQMILDYLDELAGPEHTLTPPSGHRRIRVLRVIAVALGVAEKVVALNVETGRRSEGTVDPRMIERLGTQVRSGLQWLEAQRPDPWFVDDDMTQADVTTVCMLTHLVNRQALLFPQGAYPLLGHLRERAEDLPDFQAYPFMEG